MDYDVSKLVSQSIFNDMRFSSLLKIKYRSYLRFIILKKWLRLVILSIRPDRYKINASIYAIGNRQEYRFIKGALRLSIFACNPQQVTSSNFQQFQVSISYASYVGSVETQDLELDISNMASHALSWCVIISL